MVGGAAVTEEIAPGTRCPTLAHSTGPLRPSIVADMQLARRVEFLRPTRGWWRCRRTAAPWCCRTTSRAAAEAIRAHSADDAERYPDFVAALERLGAFLLRLLEQTPPSLDQPGRQEIWELLKTGRQFRKLGRTDAYRLLRWMPMAAADLVSEWFTGDLLQAVVASRGIFGAAAGPWSGGTGAALLMNAATDPVPGGSTITVKGGPGALTHAMADAAREAGATIRLDAPVARIAVANGRAQGVMLQDGSEIPASAVISNADPRRTLLALVDPDRARPGRSCSAFATTGCPAPSPK